VLLQLIAAKGTTVGPSGGNLWMQQQAKCDSHTTKQHKTASPLFL